MYLLMLNSLLHGSRTEQDSFGAEMNGSWGDSSVRKHNWGCEYDSDVALYYFGGKRSWFSPERGMYLQHGSGYGISGGNPGGSADAVPFFRPPKEPTTPIEDCFTAGGDPGCGGKPPFERPWPEWASYVWEKMCDTKVVPPGLSEWCKMMGKMPDLFQKCPVFNKVQCHKWHIACQSACDKMDTICTQRCLEFKRWCDKHASESEKDDGKKRHSSQW